MDTKSFDLCLDHRHPPRQEFPSKVIWISVVFLTDHQDGPWSPEKVVQNHAILCHFDQAISLLLPCLFILLLRCKLHRVLEIAFNQVLDVGITRHILVVVVDPTAIWVSVVAHVLIQVIPNIVHSWVPVGVLVVDQH